MKKIYILRHAKAVPAGIYPTDHERPLTPQGKTASRMMGEYVHSLSNKPEMVLCSDSARTRETWIEFAKGLASDLPVTYTRKLYLASVNVLLAQLHALPDAIESVLLIGHNPGMHQLALQLAAKDRNPAWDELEYGFPTASIAIITHNVDAWGLVEPGMGKLCHYLPRKRMQSLTAMAQGA